MAINISKTVVITFGSYVVLSDYTISGKQINRVKETKDLGLIVDQGITFKSHFLKIIKKANFFAYNVIKILKSCSAQNKVLIFKTYIRPILEYNIILYFPRQRDLKTQIENVQKRFTKRIFPWGISYSQRLELLSDVD